MAKFCIFCGEHPVDKNKEHIIPQWLIHMTGEPKRATLLGKKDGKEIRFSWLNYVFPACTSCNTEFGKIEGQIKAIYIKIRDEQLLSHNEMNLFLDWLDKVRIGLWLGQAQLLKRDINPNFYINSRVGNKDRLLLVYKIDDNEKGIGLLASDSAIFQYVPSCFGLIVNNLVFFNYSKEFILSKNLGFPYVEEFSYNSKREITFENFARAKYEVTYPILNGKIIKPCIKFYQSIIVGLHGYKRPFAGKGYKYVNNNCLSYTNEVIQSRIFISDEISDTHGFWTKGVKHKFVHDQPFNRHLITYAVTSMVLKHQIDSAQEALDHLDELEKEEQDAFKGLYKLLINSNQEFCDEIDELIAPIIKDI